MKKVSDIRTFFKKSLSATQRNNQREDDTPSKDGHTSPSPSSAPSMFEASKPTDEKYITEVRAYDPTDLGTLQTGPKQPVIDFPKTLFGDRNRSFSDVYYKKHQWLEYSVEKDRAYCFVCRHFFTGVVRDQNEKFIKTGFSKWKKLSAAIEKHEKSGPHSDCHQKYLGYQMTKASGTVHERVLNQSEEEIEEKKRYLTKVADIVSYLSCQGMPLRGHQESSDSQNRGNFIELCKLFAKYDDGFEKHFLQRLNYCSPTVQNEIIDIAASLTIQEIVKEVRECGFYSLMVDEAKCHKEEQLSIILRYVKGLEPTERFLGFLNCSKSRDAESLSQMIQDFLIKCGLENIPMIAQSYDGASVMSGKNAGLQAKMKMIHPYAVYIHCLAHKVNLVVVHSCSNIQSAKVFFNTLESLHIHYSQPGNHANLAEIQKKLGIKGGKELSSLSCTRWSARYANCNVVINNFNAIKEALEKEINDARDGGMVEAIGLLRSITKPEFVVNLFVIHSVLSVTQVLSKYLQGTDATLGRASSVISSVQTTFSENRNNFDGLWREIEEFSNINDISLEPLSVSKKRKQQLPEKLNEYCVETAVGKSQLTDLPSDTKPREYWKINVFNRVMDNVLSHFKHRFESVPLAEAADAFTLLNLAEAEDFINNYKVILNIDTHSLNAEATVLRNILKNKGLEVSLKTVKKEVSKDIMPNVYKLLQVAVGLPVSSSGCERSFSVLRRIKSWVRSTTGQSRFSNLSILHIEKTLVTEKVPAASIIEHFCQKNRKFL